VFPGALLCHHLTLYAKICTTADRLSGHSDYDALIGADRDDQIVQSNRGSAEHMNQERRSARDAIDRAILEALDADPRMTILGIAHRTGLARGTVQARLDRFEREAVLRPHSVRINPEALGMGISAHVAAELDQHRIDLAVEGLRAIPEVIECLAPAGETDLLCRVVARDPDDLYRVSEEIRLCPGILRTRTSMFLRQPIPYRMAPLLGTIRD
jgi:DNA-binding Lrp family transcriptional regulator